MSWESEKRNNPLPEAGRGLLFFGRAITGGGWIYRGGKGMPYSISMSSLLWVEENLRA